MCLKNPKKKMRSALTRIPSQNKNMKNIGYVARGALWGDGEEDWLVTRRYVPDQEPQNARLNHRTTAGRSRAAFCSLAETKAVHSTA